MAPDEDLVASRRPGPRARQVELVDLLRVAEVDQLDGTASGAPQELVQLVERALRPALVIDTQAAGVKRLE